MSATHGHWINGTDTPSNSGATIDSLKPGTGEVFATYADGNAADIDAAATAASAATNAWAGQKPIERGRLLMAIANELRARQSELGEMESAEAGKSVPMATAEIGLSADYFELYAGLVNTLTGDVVDIGPDFHTYVVREPYGVVGIITPWNAGLNQASRAASVALAAGNTVVIKPSEMTSSTTLALAEMATKVGVPDGVINVVTGVGPQAGQALVNHPSIAKIAFTGSVRAGREVARAAAERLIPVSLELGGKSPNIVFEDCDFKAAVRGALQAFMLNTGQICSNGTRLFVHESIHDEFVAAMIAALPKAAPMFLSQLTTEAQHDKVNEYFAIAKDEGLTLETGGVMKNGWRPEATIYTDVSNDSRIAREEIFGPVVGVIKFSTEEEVVAMANDSDYGLAAGLWTADLSRAHRVAAQLEAGQVYVNTWGAPNEVPFGGFKQSGYGREKGIEALRSYTHTKSINIKL